MFYHARDLQRMGGEGAAAQQVQTSSFAHTYRARNAAFGVVLLVVLAFALLDTMSWTNWLLISVAITSAATIGRMLFYALVIPTTMPGAFFWRNPAFEQHARETGLAKMPQVGVAMDCH